MPRAPTLLSPGSLYFTHITSHPTFFSTTVFFLQYFFYVFLGTFFCDSAVRFSARSRTPIFEEFSSSKPTEVAGGGGWWMVGGGGGGGAGKIRTSTIRLRKKAL